MLISLEMFCTLSSVLNVINVTHKPFELRSFLILSSYFTGCVCVFFCLRLYNKTVVVCGNILRATNHIISEQVQNSLDLFLSSNNDVF